MPEWLTIVLALGGSALISSVVGFVFNQFINGTRARKQRNEELIESLNRNNETLRKGVQALLRHELYDLYNKWIPRGYCPNEVKNDFENIYSQYHSLGKNGVMDKCREEFEALPSIATVVQQEEEHKLPESEKLRVRRQKRKDN